MEQPVQRIRVSVGEGAIDAAGLLNEVGRPDSGATILFRGTVRDHSDRVENVTHLEYEVYAGVVEASIREIVDEASGKWPLLSVAVEHRSGVVTLGEASVAVAVATGMFSRDELLLAAPDCLLDDFSQPQSWFDQLV